MPGVTLPMSGDRPGSMPGVLGLIPGMLGADGPVPRRDRLPGSATEGGPLRVPESGRGTEIEGGAEDLPGSGRALMLPLRLEMLGPDGGRTVGAAGGDGLDELPRLDRVPRSDADAAMDPPIPGVSVRPDDGRDGAICVDRGIEGNAVEPENEPRLLLRLLEIEGTLLCGNDGADTAGALRESENEPAEPIEPDEPIRGAADDTLGAEGTETDGAGEDGRDSIAPEDPPDRMLLPLELPRLELAPRESAHAANAMANAKTAVAMICIFLFLIMAPSSFRPHGHNPDRTRSKIEARDTAQGTAKDPMDIFLRTRRGCNRIRGPMRCCIGAGKR